MVIEEVYHFQRNVMGEQLTVVSWPPVVTFETSSVLYMYLWVYSPYTRLNVD